MKVQVTLCDTGRPTGIGTLNLLNAGWSITGGPPQPAQAIAVFLEVPWSQLNRQLSVLFELVDDEGRVVHLMTPEGPQAASFEQPMIVGNIPGAPNGTPGTTTTFLEVGPGVLQLPSGHRYTWRISVDGHHEEAWEAAFWVQQQLPPPRLGGSPPPT